MSRGWRWKVLLVLALGFLGCEGRTRPVRPPAQPPADLRFDRVVRLHVEYDQTLEERFGDGVEDVVREAIAILNLEWRRYRHEWFELGELTFGPRPPARDAQYVLVHFLNRTAHEKDAIHVNVVGHPLEVYPNGRTGTPVGGLAYRGSDVIVISATDGVGPEMLAYYLFHELGHCWDAYDLPFHGGETTFGSKTRITFQLDAGNEQIMADSGGPQARDAGGRAPLAIRRKLALARMIARNSVVYPRLHDLLLYEPSPANPAYLAGKRAVLADAGRDRKAIAALLRQFEYTPRLLRQNARTRQQFAEHYWRADAVIADRDFAAAERELRAIGALSRESPDLRMLVGAVAKKVRIRR